MQYIMPSQHRFANPLGTNNRIVAVFMARSADPAAGLAHLN
jgi:hypothetical protein